MQLETTLTRKRFFGAAAAVTAAGILALGTSPVLAQTTTLGEIDVTQAPYSASTTGKSDDTAIFQKALNAAGVSGAKVRVPAGQYLFTGTLTVPPHVALEGVNDGERSYGGYMNGTTAGDVTANAGTVFLVTGGAGNLGGTQFLTLSSDSALRNVTIYYPNQPLSTAAGWTAPKVYPPAINFAGHNGTVENVCGINPYAFITNSGIGNTIRRVFGQPLYFGINLDGDADPTGQSGERMEDVRFLNTWDNHPAMVQYMQSHSSGIVIYRADEFAMRNCSCTGYLNGFVFSSSGFGAAYGTLTSCSALHCAYAVAINACKAGAGGGLVFDGGGFGSSSGQAVSIGNKNTGNVTFNSCRFYSSPGTLITNASAAGSVSLLGCSFENWGVSASGLNPAVPCVYCGDSSAPNGPSGKTRMLNCNFDVDQYQYTYTPGEAGVLFENNATVDGIHVQVSGVAPPSAAGPNYIQINNF